MMKRLSLMAFMLLYSSFIALSQDTYDWDINAPDGNFKQGAAGCRWSKNSGSGGCYWDEPGFGILIFNNNANLTMSNNATNFNTYRMEFLASGTSSRSIAGNSITFYDYSNSIPAIINLSGANHSLSTPIQIGNTSTSTSPAYGFEINAYNGTLNIGSTISAANSSGTKVLVLMSFNGSSGSSPINLSGVISDGSGTLALQKKDNNTATLSAQNSYTGSTTVNGGTLILNATGGNTLSASSAVVVNSGGTLQISTDQTINNLTVNAGGTIIIDNGASLTIGSTYSCAGTITNNGTIILNGVSSFPGSSATISSNFNNLEINSNVSLDKNITVTGSLKLTSGSFTLGSNNLTLGSSATITGTPSSSNMVITNSSGELRKEYASTGSFTFPIGTTGEYTPVTLSFSAGTFNNAYASAISVASKHANNSSSNDYLERNWILNQSGISAFSCDISCVYVDADVVGTEANIYCGKYASGTWTPASSTNTSTNTLTFSAASSFSDITGGELTALPVSLISFTGTALSNHTNLIQWSTASEINSSYFELEKRLPNGEFTVLTKMQSADYSQKIVHYEFTDNQVNPVEYYQLQQYDFDGKRESFGPIKVLSKAENTISLFPNPAHHEIQINLGSNFEKTSISFTVYNVLGKKVFTEITEDAGIFRLPVLNFENGIYFLMLEINGIPSYFKFTKD